MATKPATTPVQWDSNGTNVTTPSAGQQSDGAATNAILASGIFNYLMKWMTAWVIYLADGIIQHSVKTRTYSAAAGNANVAVNAGDQIGIISNVDGAGSGSGSWFPAAGTTDQWFQWGLTFDAGERLRELRVRCNGDTTETLRMRVFKIDATGGATQIGTDQTTATTNTDQTLTVSGLTETILSTLCYIVELRATGSGVAARMLEVDYDRVTS